MAKMFFQWHRAGERVRVPFSVDLQMQALQAAGRAVVAVALGVEVQRLELVPGSRRNAACLSIPPDLPELQRAVLQLAGLAALERELGRRLRINRDTDDSDVQAVLDRVDNGGLALAWNEAQCLIDDNGRAVDELAGQLLRRGELAGEEVETLCQLARTEKGADDGNVDDEQ